MRRYSLQSADVTNIVSRVKSLADYMFRQNTPAVVQKIQGGIQTGLDNFNTGLAQMDKAEQGLKDGVAGLQAGVDGMKAGLDGAQKGVDQLKQGIAGLDASIAAAPSPAAKAPLEAQRQQLQAALDQAQAKLAGLQASLGEAQGKLAGMQQGVDTMDAARAKLLNFKAELQQLHDSIPGVFDQSLSGYLSTLDGMAGEIESTFQSGLNVGFRGMFFTVAAAAAIAGVVLAFYRGKKKPGLKEKPAEPAAA